MLPVAGYVYAFGGCRGIIIDGLGEGPARVDVGDVTDGAEDSPRARVLAV